MEEHDRLLNLVIKKPEDYEPFGELKKWEKENVDYPDCSCGCGYFIPLRGSLGADWGVCSNPESHRNGLLTNEHQGCLKFNNIDKKRDYL
jgi:hypothetical protein